MKIINVNDFYTYPLTADSTAYTADSTELTADMISFDSNKLFITITPRAYPTEVNITFYNELRETTHTEKCIVVNHNGYMDVPFDYNDFVEGDSFEITVTKLTGQMLYRGKAQVLMTDDLQNYKLITPDTNNVIKF